MSTRLLVTGEFTNRPGNVIVSKQVSVHTLSEMGNYRLVKENI